MALGWPVSENGPAPGLPMWAVARCRLTSAVFLAVPLDDWFRPWQYRLRVAADVAKRRVASSRSAWLTPQTCATFSGV